MRIKNYGFIDYQPQGEDYLMGVVEKDILNPERDWTNWLPTKEVQKKDFETSACVTFSALNCLETLFKKQYGLELNFSDRFTAKASGTTTIYGNTFKAVADSIRNIGMVDEERYPWGGEDVKEYYQPIPSNIVQRAKAVITNYDIHYEFPFATNEKLSEALQYAPVQIAVRAWKKPNSNGVYDYVDKNTNHAVMLFRIDEDGTKYIYDHYDKDIKVLSPQFYVRSALIYSLKLKETIRPFYFATLYKEKYGKLPKAKDYLTYLKTKQLPL